MINNIDLEMMLSEVVRRTDNKFPEKRKKKKFDKATAERVMVELTSEQHSEIMIYHAFLWSNLHSRVKDSDTVYQALQKLEQKHDDKAFVIRYLIYDVFEWIKDPMSIVDHRKVYRKNPLLTKAHEVPVDFLSLESEYGIKINKNSTLMKISIDELIHLCSYKLNLAYEFSDLNRMRKISKRLISDSKKRKKPLFNEAMAFLEILERPYKKDIVFSRFVEDRPINYDYSFNMEILKNITVYHLRKQAEKGVQGFSHFSDKVREQFRIYRESILSKATITEGFESVQINEVIRIINSNSKELRNLILQGENQFLNYLVENAYRKEFGNAELFEDENFLVKDLTLKILLHHIPLEKSKVASKLTVDSFDGIQKNTEYIDSDIIDYLCDVLPSDQVFASSKKVMKFFKELTYSRYDKKKIYTKGYEISAINSPVKAFFDSMGNYCLSGGSKFKMLYHTSSRPMPLRDFGLDYILNSDIFHIIGLNEINGKAYSPLLAKANSFVAEKMIRKEHEERKESVLVIDDVPGLDSLNFVFPGWIENMYHAIMKYAMHLNKKGANLSSVIFNISHSESQKSVKEFIDYVKTRKEAFRPEQVVFELERDGNVIDIFRYNFEIRTKKVPIDLIKKLRQGGYEHYVGQHCIDATYAWYDFMEKNLGLIPETKEELYGPFTETRGQIKELMKSNDKLFLNRMHRPGFNFGNGLINGIEVRIDDYLNRSSNFLDIDILRAEHNTMQYI